MKFGRKITKHEIETLIDTFHPTSDQLSVESVAE